MSGRIDFVDRFAGPNRPTVIKPDHITSAAQSIQEPSRDQRAADIRIEVLSHSTAAIMNAIYEAQVQHRNQETLIVDATDLAGHETLSLFFTALVFAYRYEADCLDGLPAVVFYVQHNLCKSLHFLFRLVQTKEDVTLSILHDYMQLLLTQGGDSSRTDWLPDMLL
jgi:hypothetical protein